ncbi:MAG TPA: hypothetical protein VNR70_07270 [Steroidobacteraceae bacterium]|nr:hypothetical protein [Steroidobacteraceae bacterium]
MRQTVSGRFSARNLGGGAWQLVAGAASGTEIFLQGAGPDALELLQDASISVLGFEWHVDGVEIAVTGANGVRYLTTESAIIHAPSAHVYDGLPLARFDSDAKRFWTRVFRLIRIPGGRFLLGFIARGKRGKSKPAKP